MKLSSLLCVVLLCLAINTFGKKCDSFSKLTAGDKCHLKWKKMQPLLRVTQNNVGYAWVQRKINVHMGSLKDAQKALDKRIIPVVKSPEDFMYILDHHHLLAALDYSGLTDAEPTISVVCDFSYAKNMQQFWKLMLDHLLVYNYGRPSDNHTVLPTELDVYRLPTVLIFKETYSSMMDDPWRSFTGLTRKSRDDICETQVQGNSRFPCRGYIKNCNAKGYGVPYFEYRWSYFVNAAWLNTSLWNNSSDYEAFAKIYNSLPPSKPGKVDTKPWVKATNLLLPLFRGESAGSYEVPANMGTTAGKLPGYVRGYQPIPNDDPICDVPICG